MSRTSVPLLRLLNAGKSLRKDVCGTSLASTDLCGNNMMYCQANRYKSDMVSSVLQYVAPPPPYMVLLAASFHYAEL